MKAKYDHITECLILEDEGYIGLNIDGEDAEIQRVGNKLAAALSDDGWTYCDDRQPPSDIAEIYLASTFWGGLEDVEILTFDGKKWGEWPLSTRIRDDVIAWRPLPEPAKGRDV